MPECSGKMIHKIFSKYLEINWARQADVEEKLSLLLLKSRQLRLHVQLESM